MSDEAVPTAEPDDIECVHLIQQLLNGTPDEQNSAWRRLEPVVKATARRVAAKRCLSKQRRSDLIELAPGYVFDRLRQFDPQKGTFRAWLYRVVEHVAIDQGRKARRDKKILDKIGEFTLSERNVPHTPLLPHSISISEALSPNKVESLERMPLLQRVIAVALAGLAPRVPEQKWANWLQKADIPGPFPPSEIYNFDEPMERIPCLAIALNMKPEAVRQHWYRARKNFQNIFEDWR